MDYQFQRRTFLQALGIAAALPTEADAMPIEFDDAAHYALVKHLGATSVGKSYEAQWSEFILIALKATGIPDNMVDGLIAPRTNKLWLDKTSNPAVLRYWSEENLAWLPITYDKFFRLAAGNVVNDVVNQGNVPTYSAVQDLSALDIPEGISAIRLNGFAVVGDDGDWPLALAVPNIGILQPWQRETNGRTRRWELAPGGPLRPEMFGAFQGSGNDSVAGLIDLYAAAAALNRDVELSSGRLYYVKSGTLTIPENVVTHAHGGADIVGSFPGVVVREGTTIMYRPLGGSQVRGILVDVAQGTGGTARANPHSYNFFRVQRDQLDGTLGSGSKVNGFFISHTFGGPGTKGGRHALEARLSMTASSEATNTDRNYCSVAGSSTASANDGGMLGAERGAVFGMNPQGRLKGAATNYLNVTGGEANVGIAAGASSQMRTGWSIIGLGDPVRGYNVDAALSISNYGDPTTGAYFKDGILLGAQNGRPAIREDSTVIRLQGNTSVANGIDFNDVTFTTDILRAANVKLRNSEIILQASNAHLTLGNPSEEQRPYVEFRSGGAGAAYDTRLISSGGSTSTGQGDLWVVAANFVTSKHRPFADNTDSLGDGSFRWSQLYAGTATINTSDEMLKTPFRPFTELEREAISACVKHIGIYQWLDAIEDKGEDGARLHGGVPAQRCVAEFESRGLDPWRYAWFCRDPKIKTVKCTRKAVRQVTEDIEIEEVVIEVIDGTPVQRRISRTVHQPKFEQVPVVDEEGNPVTITTRVSEGFETVIVDGALIEQEKFREIAQQQYFGVPVMEEYETEIDEQIEVGGYLYSIRHTELIMAMLAVLTAETIL